MIPWALRDIYNDFELTILYTGAKERTNTITNNVPKIGRSIKIMILPPNHMNDWHIKCSIRVATVMSSSTGAPG